MSFFWTISQSSIPDHAKIILPYSNYTLRSVTPPAKSITLASYINHGKLNSRSQMLQNDSFCPPVFSCSDSPLSITGNVIGILTLAYGIFAGGWIYSNKIESYQDDLFAFMALFDGFLFRVRFGIEFLKGFDVSQNDADRFHANVQMEIQRLFLLLQDFLTSLGYTYHLQQLTFGTKGGFAQNSFCT